MAAPDSRDFAILHRLDSSARSSLSEIAKAARLSKSAVSQRIAALEREGYIEGYYAVIDSSRLGYLSFRVYIKFYRTSPRKEAKVIDFLMKNSKVWWLGNIQGTWDIGFIAWAKDLYDFNNLWFDFLARFKPSIGNYQICPYIKLRHFTLAHLSKEASQAREIGIVGEGPRIELDAADRKILQVISENSRDTVIALGRKAGLSPAVVHYRLKQLIRKGVIQSLRARINTQKLGYSLYKVEFYLDDMSKLPQLTSFTESIPDLAYIDHAIGGGDFEAEFNLKSEHEANLLLNKFKNRFYSAIREIRYIVYPRVLKYASFPG